MAVNEILLESFSNILKLLFDFYGSYKSDDLSGYELNEHTLRTNWLSGKSFPDTTNYSALRRFIKYKIDASGDKNDFSCAKEIEKRLPIEINDMPAYREAISGVQKDRPVEYILSVLDLIFSNRNTKTANGSASNTHGSTSTGQKKEKVSAHPMAEMEMMRNFIGASRHFVYDTVKDFEDFKFIFGDYHCYFYPSISSQKRSILSANLKIFPSEETGVCRATLVIDIGRDNEITSGRFEKVYEGFVVISKKVECVYCVLISHKVGEIALVSFRWPNLDGTLLRSRVAEVLTNTAGSEDNYPVVFRMFLSREEIDEQHYWLFSPHLKLNNSDIIIRKSDYEIIKNREKYKSFHRVFAILEHSIAVENSAVYIIKESLIIAQAEQLALSKSTIFELVTEMREKSLSAYNNKVGETVDDIVFNTLRDHGYYQFMRRKPDIKACVFDFDALTIGVNTSKATWEDIWEILGYTLEECHEHHQQFVNKMISQAEWKKITQDKFIKRQLHKSHIHEVSKRLQLLAGAKALFQYCYNKDVKIYIVSGSINNVIMEVFNNFDVPTLGIEMIEANGFLFDENDILYDIRGTKYEYSERAKFLKEVISQRKISPDQVLFVGNSKNDEYAYSTGVHTLCINPYKTDHNNSNIWHKAIERCEDLEILKSYIDQT